MCDYFLKRVEGDQQAGDLTDIVRAGGAMPAGSADPPSTATEWLQLPTDPILFPLPQSSSSDGAGPSSADALGDPFSGLPDAFSADYPSSSGSAAADFFDAVQDAMGVGMAKQVGFVDTAGCGGGGTTVGAGGGGFLDMRNHHMFPGEMPMRGLSPYALMGGGAAKLGVPMAGHGQAAGPCAFDAVAGLQMSSSPRGGGIKRRKNQARKVLCIPAPAAAVAGKTTGEVVPSDLWAWRKYGQKPIKGSPYPRGYYRCSSSKGCPARKQVERSRTDPNMLVITYTSEHNHPWPTQRNVLAGSTRSHYAKNSSSNTAAASSKNSKNSSRNQHKPVVKAESKDQSAATPAATSTTTTATTSTGNNTPPMTVKEEAEMERRINGDTTATVGYYSDHLLQQMFSQSYRPMMPEEAGGYHQQDDFFADLTELDSDPVSLIFSTEYMEARPDKEKAAAKDDVDSLFMMDWAPASAAVTTSARSALEQGDIGL